MLAGYLLSLRPRKPVLYRNYLTIRAGFYRAMLCIRGTSHGHVSVRLSVCHKSEFY